jgi:UDP-glucose 4-epimerase
MFRNKTVLLTGGTGSFGNAFIKRYLDSDIKQIVIFSRDEKKQDDMRMRYKSSKLKFVLGNITNPDAVNDVCEDVDYIFHAAALKQVPSCEFSPIEASRVNIFGTENLIRAAKRNNVKKITFLSTGKAVRPINAMGISKAMMEKVILQNARDLKERGKNSPVMTIIRYSNIFASRGSAVNVFIDQIKKSEPITITHPNMYRSMMHLDEAVDLAVYAMENGDHGDLFIYKAKKTSLLFLAKALQEIFDAPNREIKIIGKRHGEKLQETILSDEELLRVTDMGAYCKVSPDQRTLNYYAYRGENRRDIADQEEREAYQLQVPKLTKEDLMLMLQHEGIDTKIEKVVEALEI